MRYLPLWALCAACAQPAAVSTVDPASLDPSTAPEAAVRGELDGARFDLREAWFRVDRRASRARVDLVLSEGRATRLCAVSEPEHARHLWLRFDRTTELAPGTLRAGPTAEPPLSAHWESRASGRWQGRPGAVAVQLDSVTPALVTGRLRACFGPGAEGCVAGTFQARRCVTELELDGPLAGNVRRADTDGGPAP